jgi:hypothetical protein
VLGIASGVAQPSRLALIPTLVDRESLASALAINSVIFNLPVLFLAPFAGVLADRRDRVWTIRLTQWIGCVQASLLAILVVSDAMTIEILFALVLDCAIEPLGCDDMTTSIFLKIGNPKTPYGMDAAVSLRRSCRPAYRSAPRFRGSSSHRNPARERAALQRHGALHGTGVGGFSSPSRGR